MVNNNFSVIINGVTLTRYAVFPLKNANLLDERLDECYLSLRHVCIDRFAPTSLVQITINNVVAYGANVISDEQKTTNYIVANDEAIESPVGSGLYNHDIYLIELTKYLEMVVVESLTFTNSLGRDSLSSPQPASVTTQPAPTYGANIWQGAIWSRNVPAQYQTPLALNSSLTIAQFKDVAYPESSTGYTIIDGDRASIVVKHNSDVLWSSQGDLLATTTLSLNQAGRYDIIYTYYSEYDITSWTQYYNTVLTFSLYIAENQYPLKRLTCKDVINRLLDLAEPLVYGATPRFTLDAEQAELFDKIYAPQFSMTRQTLRECLKEVGKIVHGEPRLTLDESDNYVIKYDLYGGTDMSYIGQHVNIYNSTTQQIEQFCAVIDSSASNMINQTDWAAGVITEPDNYYYKTVRTETQYVRITDANMIIATDRPVYQLAKTNGLKVLVPNGRYVTGVDLTPYVVESTIYNSQLSSYDTTYPYSKAYGLYFTQGEKNIYGLNFKPDQAIAPAFANYAIINIIERACSAAGIDWTFNGNYAELLFQVTYVPYFDIRVAQSKPYYPEFNGAYALIYNQTANTIESRYYGENLKGVVARLGNPEMVITYNLSRLSQIPVAGQLYDSDHYIAAVTTEIYPTHFKCMVALSKDFNRLSQFVGISSEKRYYEVSERQTYDRSTLYHEYITVGNEEVSDSSLIQSDFMAAVADTFTQTGDYKPLTRVVAWGGTYSNPISVESYNGQTSPLPCVRLPVVSVALGNSMCFVWNYQDNYSAGAISQYAASGEISGYWQNDYQYTDYYGRMYYYNFGIYMPDDTNVNAAYDLYDLMVDVGLALPESSYPSEQSTFIATTVPYIYRKDSREIPQFNVQVEFVTNRADLIIGSALASSCGLIRGSDSSLKAELYVLDAPINKFTTRLTSQLEFADVTLPAPVDITITPAVNNRFYITSDSFNTSGKSWAIVTAQTQTSETVQDEQGNITTQTMYSGGEILLACNGDFAAGDDIGQIWFCPRRDPWQLSYMVIFYDTEIWLPIPTPSSVVLNTVNFYDEQINIIKYPISISTYTVEFSDEIINISESPTPVSQYTITFSNEKITVIQEAESINLYSTKFSDEEIVDIKRPTQIQIPL